MTFRDNMAKKFYEELQNTLEEPVIIIFASAKIGPWKGCLYKLSLYFNYKYTF